MGLIIVWALPNVFKITLVFLIDRGISKMTALLFDAAESEKITLPGVFPETSRPTRRIIVVIIYIFVPIASFTSTRQVCQWKQ
jgi:hypothetical protein